MYVFVYMPEYTYITYIHPACRTGAGTNARRRSLTVCGALLLQFQKAPLHCAVQNGHGSVVDQLLQGRADVILKDYVYKIDLHTHTHT